MMKRQGFTLAEVLITLGIIGVVAAMTIPTLISNTNGAQFKTAYKKALSTLNQAVLMNIAMEDYDFSSLVAETDKGADADGTVSKTMSFILRNRMQSATNITDTYTLPSKIKYTYYDYTCTESDKTAEGACKGQNAGTKVDSYEKDVTPDTNWSVFTFADGTSFGYNGNAASCSTKNDTCVGFIDVNGSTNPNQVVECTTGKEGGTGSDTTNGACQVEASGITDVYPVFIYGQTVEPGSDAARSVLFGK